MDRTLYLSEKKGLFVMRDGPSLWIKEKDKAGTRVPARLINMVFIIGNIRMDAGTLTLFAENNTPVTFMSKSGEAIGVVLPYNHTLSDRRDEQRRFLSRLGNVEAFRTWAASMRRETQIAVMKKIDWETTRVYLSHGFREQDYGELINRRRLSCELGWKTVHGILTNLILETIIKEIVGFNLDPHMGTINKNCNFGLALDLSTILEPEADLIAFEFFTSARWHTFVLSTDKKCVLTKEGWRNVIHRFENRKKIIAHRLDTVIRGYFDLLRQVAV